MWHRKTTVSCEWHFFLWCEFRIGIAHARECVIKIFLHPWTVAKRETKRNVSATLRSRNRKTNVIGGFSMLYHISITFRLLLVLVFMRRSRLNECTLLLLLFCSHLRIWIFFVSCAKELLWIFFLWLLCLLPQWSLIKKIVEPICNKCARYIAKCVSHKKKRRIVFFPLNCSLSCHPCVWVVQAYSIDWMPVEGKIMPQTVSIILFYFFVDIVFSFIFYFLTI